MDRGPNTQEKDKGTPRTSLLRDQEVSGQTWKVLASRASGTGKGDGKGRCGRGREESREE